MFWIGPKVLLLCMSIAGVPFGAGIISRLSNFKLGHARFSVKSEAYGDRLILFHAEHARDFFFTRCYSWNQS